VKVRYCLACAACLLIFSASARPQHMNAKDSPCKTDATTPDLANCLWNAWTAEDKNLNAYYKTVSKHVEGDELKDLRRAENAWITYRDLNCTAEKELYDGGTAVGPVYNACMEAMTRHRLAELKTMYDWRVNK
jgi:uncharacterized protein YecT (DUF1311 family)